MSDLSPALIEELAKALYAAAHQVEVSDLEPHDVQFAGEQLAPILSRALAEAWDKGHSIGWADSVLSADATARGVDEPDETTNPYLTEKEQS